MPTVPLFHSLIYKLASFNIFCIIFISCLYFWMANTAAVLASLRWPSWPLIVRCIFVCLFWWDFEIMVIWTGQEDLYLESSVFHVDSMYAPANETLAFLCTASVADDIFLFIAIFLLLNGEWQSVFRTQYGWGSSFCWPSQMWWHHLYSSVIFLGLNMQLK